MLTNESGYVFIVTGDDGWIVGAFMCIELAMESARMSASVEVKFVHSGKMMLNVYELAFKKRILTIHKVPISQIAVGFML